ncbi:hypothetical protein MFIFM68171_06143 [Madurella fahalii]|uniref:Uncharacterized protein n=1 Tax=Madurella fahalii TaxID=1157608 RepID=A0ABQ0GDT9_9PEZI
MHIPLRLRLRPAAGGGPDGIHETAEPSEKRIPKSRTWSVVLLAALRFCQLAYSALAYYSLAGFGAPSGIHDIPQHGPSNRWPDPAHRSVPTMRTMRWLRIQAFVVLMYQTVVLVGLCLLRAWKTRKRLPVGLATVFGDGCAVMAALNIMMLLDTPYGTHCHGPSQGSPYGLLGPNRGHGAKVSQRRSVCRLLDLVVGLGAVFILSHILSAFSTIWRARNTCICPAAYAEAQHARDVEQGPVQDPGPVEEVRPQPMLQRGRTPPPPYHPVVPELAQDSPRGRSSVETTSSIRPEVYLVSDGWRAPEEPPEYSSRPPSLRNAPP